MLLYCKQSVSRDLHEGQAGTGTRMILRYSFYPLHIQPFAKPILTTKLLAHFFSALHSMSFFICNRKNASSIKTSNIKDEFKDHEYAFFAEQEKW
jgi:hypothetical protein